MKTYILTIQGFDGSPEGDNRPFAYEEHQLILNEDEHLAGVCMVYIGSEPMKIDLDSKLLD